MKKSAILGLLATFSAFAQMHTLTATTTAAAVATTDTVISLTSVTGVNVPNVVAGEPGSELFILDPGNSRGEVTRVLSVSGTNVTVTRDNGGKATAHVAGAMVLIGEPSWFFTTDPAGSCTAPKTLVTPVVNTQNGNQWLCSTVTGTWVPGWGNLDAAPAVSAAVASAAGLVTPSGPLFHITGTAAITGFNIPVGFAAGGFCVIPDGAFTTTNANNIALGSTAVVSKQLCFSYDSNTAKFYPSY